MRRESVVCCDSGAMWMNVRSLKSSVRNRGVRALRIRSTYCVGRRAAIWIVTRGFTRYVTYLSPAGSARVLQLASCEGLSWLKLQCQMPKSMFYEIALTKGQLSETSQVGDSHLPSGHCTLPCSGSSQGTITHCSVQWSSISAIQAASSQSTMHSAQARFEASRKR